MTKPISEKRPWVSRSMGVHPRDAKDASEHAKRRGFRHEYNEKGFVVAKSKAGVRDAMKMHNKFNRDAGYSDQSPS